jgi:calcineurin-like phosphoesterase family protein
MQNLFLVSDTHFGHQRELDFGRPKGYEDRILKAVRNLPPNSLLIHLGDICFGADAYWHDIIEALNCQKILVRGNHDHKSNNWYLTHGWDFVCNEFSGDYFGEKILFSHIPQLYDQKKYSVNVHGHLHDNRHRGSTEEFVFKGRSYRLVSMEFLKYQPVKLETLLQDKTKKYGDTGQGLPE